MDKNYPCIFLQIAKAGCGNKEADTKHGSVDGLYWTTIVCTTSSLQLTKSQGASSLWKT